MKSENNNNDLNAISLGGVNNTEVTNKAVNEIPSVKPLNLEEQPEALNMDENLNGQTINGSIPPVSTIPNINQLPETPANLDIPQVINNQNVTPFLNEIGTVPPIPDVPVVPIVPINDGIVPTEITPNKKKPSTLLFIIIIVLALTAVGVGVYILLGIAREKEKINNTPTVVLKDVTIELNSDPSTNIEDYAEFKNIDSSTCELDTTKIADTSALNAEYEFTIICQSKNYTGKVKIVDTQAPKVTTKDVSVSPNGEVEPSEFIQNCEDASECSYTFKDESSVKKSLETSGEYKIVIIVKDAAGNETEVTVNLIVNEMAASLYLNCIRNNSGNIEYIKFGLNNNIFIKKGLVEYTFVLSESDYNNFKNANVEESEVTYKGITGSAEFNDTDHTVKITTILSYDELKIKFGKDIPDTYEELKEFVESRNYKCTIGF